MRRLARLCVTPELIAGLGSGRYEVTSNPVPPDATIFRSGYDQAKNEFVIVLEHESFAPLEAVDQPPELTPPVIRRLKEDVT